MKFIILLSLSLSLTACSFGEETTAQGIIVSVEKSMGRYCDFGYITLQSSENGGETVVISLDTMTTDVKSTAQKYLGKKVNVVVHSTKKAFSCAKDTVVIVPVAVAGNN